MSRAENTPFTTEHVEWSAFKWFVYANTCHRFFFLFIHFKIENLTKSEVFVIFFNFFNFISDVSETHVYDGHRGEHGNDSYGEYVCGYRKEQLQG